MDRLLAWKPTEHENRKLVKHLRNERDALFTFLRDPSVPASNWWGEQAIRPLVVTRKIWGGNRTELGAITQQNIGTFFRTCHQQGADPFALIAQGRHSIVGPGGTARISGSVGQGILPFVFAAAPQAMF